jgi:hypothetical protein
VAVDDAVFVSQSVPATVLPGAAFQATFTLRNTGTTPWSDAQGYRLGSWAPQDNTTWGTGRIDMQGGTTVAPNDTLSFTADLTAPTAPGSYTMQWRMVHEGVAWFGDPTTSKTVQVVDPCAAHCTNGALDCGETYFDCGGDCAPCAPIELGNISADGGYPRIAIASPSRVMVVWARRVSNNDHIRWRCFDGLDWSPIEPITTGSSWQEYPWIVADSQGRFHVVHNDGGADNRRVHYNRYDAPDCSGQWQASPEILPRKYSLCAAYPSVTVDENDNPYVIWSQSRAARQSPFPSCEAGNTCSAANEHCYTLANICIPDYEQHFSRRTGGAFGAGNWTAPIDLTVGIPGTRFAHHGAIFAESSTSLHAVWMQGDPSRNIWYSQWNGTSWSPQQFTGIGAHMADVQADNQTVYVFSDNARFATRPVSPWNGAPWSSSINVAGSTHFNFVKLRLAVNGRLHAVWIQSPHTVMYSMTNVSGNWKTPKAVSPAGVDAHEPSLDVDVDRNVHIVWTECTNPACDGEHGSIWYLKTHYDEIP